MTHAEADAKLALDAWAISRDATLPLPTRQKAFMVAVAMVLWRWLGSPQPPPGVVVRFHGNWCGPGNSGPGAPVDALDQACQNHDRAYRRT